MVREGYPLDTLDIYLFYLSHFSYLSPINHSSFIHSFIHPSIHIFHHIIGSSVVLEVFRVLATSGFKPNRTVEFHAYAGEEGGLLGSQYIAKQYFEMDIIVEAMLQLDMIMYDGGQGIIVAINGSLIDIIYIFIYIFIYLSIYLYIMIGDEPIGLIRDYTNPLLTDFISLLVQSYSSLAVTDSSVCTRIYLYLFERRLTLIIINTLHTQ